MEIDEQVVKKTANLARLQLSDEDVQGLKKDLSDIITHIDTLSEVNTDGVEPTASTVEEENVFREDIAKKRFTDKDLLALSPKTGHGHYMVPKVIG